MRKTHVDLFSGIGGFALAARWAGLETVLFCEREEYAQKVLQKNFPGVPIVDDIHELTYERYVADTSSQRTGTLRRRSQDDEIGINKAAERGRVNESVVAGTESVNHVADSNSGGLSQLSKQNGQQEQPEQYAQRRSDASGRSRPFLLTGGFPCQPFSTAGSRKGTEDDRHLWPEMVRVIDELRPTWVLGENVDGILTMDDGRLIDQILADLDGIGYESQTIVIPACGVGAPHRRYRVWIVAHREDEGNIGRVSQSGNDDTTQRPGRSRSNDGREIHGGTEVNVGYRVGAGLQGHARDEAGGDEPRREPQEPRGLATPSGVRADVPDATRDGSDPRSGEGHNGPTQPRLGRDADGLPDGLDGHPSTYGWPAPLGSAQYEWEPPRTTDRKKHRTDRLKGIGNAIVPQVAYEIIREMT